MICHGLQLMNQRARRQKRHTHTQTQKKPSYSPRTLKEEGMFTWKKSTHTHKKPSYNPKTLKEEENSSQKSKKKRLLAWATSATKFVN